MIKSLESAPLSSIKVPAITIALPVCHEDFVISFPKQFEIDEVPVGKDGVEDDGGDEEDGEDGNPVIDVKPDQGLGNIGCLRSHPVHPNIGWW